MGIPLGSNFTVQTGLPLDDRNVVADITARDAIDSGRRFEGLTVYVESDSTTYQLVGGITNGDWTPFGVAIGTSNFLKDTFSGDGTTVIFTLAADPVSINNTQVYIHGVYQDKSTYTVVGTTLTFTQAPPTGTDNIEVISIGTTPIGSVADGSITTAKLADDAVTGDKILDGTITSDKLAFTIGGDSGVSPSIGSTYTTSSSSFSTVTNLSVTLTIGAKPVMLMLDSIIPSGVDATSSQYSVSGGGSGILRFIRDGNYVNEMLVPNGSGPVSIFNAIDMNAVAGTYTYTVQVRTTATSFTLNTDTVLKAVEL